MYATVAEADAEYARNKGQMSPQQEWILSDRDVWYRNPFYTGPAGRHPEDDSDCYASNEQWDCAVDLYPVDDVPY